MALSRKKKIIIGGGVGALLLIIIVASIFATRTNTPEVTVVKLQVKPELKSTVTSSGEVRPIPPPHAPTASASASAKKSRRIAHDTTTEK